MYRLCEIGYVVLRETWRVLKDDERLLVVAPNQRGRWAYMESTSFGPIPRAGSAG